MGHYPSDIVLKEIAKWNILNQDTEKLLELIENEWEYADMGGFKKEDNILELHTFGWSGNEDIISALKSNFGFWSCFWWKSERGGHYWFEIKEIKKGGKKDDEHERSTSKS